jgi:hypothetical protein
MTCWVTEFALQGTVSVRIIHHRGLLISGLINFLVVEGEPLGMVESTNVRKRYERE